MEKPMKRIIASMVIAVSISITIASVAMALRCTDRQTDLNKQLEIKQSQLYNLLKKDPDYCMAYQTRLNQLQQDFFSGKIGANEYDEKLFELTKTSSFVSEYAKRPEVKQEYFKETSAIDEIKEDIHEDSVRVGAPSIIALLLGSAGLATGAQMLISTFDDLDKEDDYTL